MRLYLGVGMAVAALATATAATAATAAAGIDDAALSASLRAIRFANQGTTVATDTYFWEDIQAVGPGAGMLYLEADNVSCTNCVWSDQGAYFKPHPYLFKEVPPNTTTVGRDDAGVCNVSHVEVGDMPGGDIGSVVRGRTRGLVSGCYSWRMMASCSDAVVVCVWRRSACRLVAAYS
jgi:hypothetical protein